MRLTRITALINRLFVNILRNY